MVRRHAEGWQKTVNKTIRWMMSEQFFPGVAALVSILPAVAFTWVKGGSRGYVFWTVLTVACIGPATAVFGRLGGEWQADFATSLWVTATASMALFMVLAATVDNVWRLAPLQSAVVLTLGIMATVWQHVPMLPVHVGIGDGWLALHIGLAVITYALVTIAAEAALAAFVQERALKAKQKPVLDGVLPPVTACDGMVVRMLAWSEVILGLGIVTGTALNIAGDGRAVHLDHKTIFTLAAFVTIGAVLYAAARHGLRGRRAARAALLAYLLLTLGYPGVKFVTDIVLN
ncbi:MAG: cytochrome c biogenesis protein CcsA [Proteobacteria bacterium]|nr:cytochrome c biogenesis protein CcsA [Pseudomonadota bacterium]